MEARGIQLKVALQLTLILLFYFSCHFFSSSFFLLVLLFTDFAFFNLIPRFPRGINQQKSGSKKKKKIFACFLRLSYGSSKSHTETIWIPRASKVQISRDNRFWRKAWKIGKVRKFRLRSLDRLAKDGRLNIRRSTWGRRLKISSERPRFN